MMSRRRSHKIAKPKTVTRKENDGQTSGEFEVGGRGYKYIPNWQVAVEELRESIPPCAWPYPDVMGSFVFLVSELGEVANLITRSRHAYVEYVRNTPGRATFEDFQHELGDTLLMLCTLASRLGVDLGVALDKRIEYYAQKYKEVNDGTNDDE